jgi:hypothetical protein
LDKRLLGDGGRGSAGYYVGRRVFHRMSVGIDQAIIAVGSQQMTDPQ